MAWPSALAATPSLHLKALLVVEPTELLEVHFDPFAFQHETNPPVAKATALSRQRTHTLSNLWVVGNASPTDRFRIVASEPASPTL